MLFTLQALGAQRIPGETGFVIEFTEHESRSLALPKAQVSGVLEELSEVFGNAIEAGLIEVAVRTDSSGNAKLQITTSSTVGFASNFVAGGEQCFVRVLPKVGTARMLELGVLAGMLPNWSLGGAHVAGTIEESLLEWTIGAYEDVLRKFLSSGGLRNTHERVQQELNNRTKGRLLVGPWLRNVARGKPHLIPSEFPSLELDNKVNRVLHWANFVGMAIARGLPNGAALVERLRISDRNFHSVQLVRPNLSSIGTIGLTTNLRHYGDALRLAELVIRNIHLGSSSGRVQSMSISLDMNKVYELAFYNGLKKLRADASRHEEWVVTLKTPEGSPPEDKIIRSTRMIPDIWIDGNSTRYPIVIDTKWKKFVHVAASPDNDLISILESRTFRLRPEDLYQATAYGLEVLRRKLVSEGSAPGCVTALVYPTMQNVPDLGRQIAIGRSQVLVRLIGWNVCAPVLNEIGAIWNRLELSATPAAAL